MTIKLSYVCITDSIGTKRWLLNGNLHQTNGPAVEYANGDKEYWVNGSRHRIDGPAVEYRSIGHNLKNSWYYRGFYCKTFEIFVHASKISTSDATLLMLKYF